MRNSSEINFRKSFTRWGIHIDDAVFIMKHFDKPICSHLDITIHAARTIAQSLRRRL